MMKEIKLYSQVLPGEIQNNLDEFIKEVKARVSPFNGLVITSAEVKDGKKVVADLRKYRKEINDAKKAVKNAWMGPYLEFEQQIKVAFSTVDGAIDPLTVQLSKYEMQRVADKIEAIDEMKTKLLIDTPARSFMDAPWFDDPKWTQMGKKFPQIQKDILDKKDSIERDVRYITTECGEYATQMLKEYFKIGDVMKVLSMKKDLEAQDKRAQEIKEQQERAAAERKIAKEKKYQEEIAHDVDNNLPETPAEPAPEAIGTEAPTPAFLKPKPEPEVRMVFAAIATKTKLKGLKEYCEQNGITITRA